MDNCDRCNRPGKVRGLVQWSASGRHLIGKYGPGCFYVAANAVRDQGHTPVDARTGRIVHPRRRGV